MTAINIIIHYFSLLSLWYSLWLCWTDWFDFT